MARDIFRLALNILLPLDAAVIIAHMKITILNRDDHLIAFH